MYESYQWEVVLLTDVQASSTPDVQPSITEQRMVNIRAIEILCIAIISTMDHCPALASRRSARRASMDFGSFASELLDEFDGASS